MSAGHARKGGEVGINQEFYKGGQYLPSSEMTVKGMQNGPKKGTKKLVAPYTWETSPADGMLSIYDRIEYHVNDNRKDCQYIKGQGFIGLKLEALSFRLQRNPDDYGDDEFIQVPVETNFFNHITRLTERWNNGERWFPMSEDPYYYLNQK